METETKTYDDLIEAFYVSQGGKPSMKEDIWFYSSDWNMLMGVVDKIEKLGFEVNICRENCLIMNDLSKISEPITLEKLPANKRFEFETSAFAGRTKIQRTKIAVLEFIKWYNNQKEK